MIAPNNHRNLQSEYVSPVSYPYSIDDVSTHHPNISSPELSSSSSTDISSSASLPPITKAIRTSTRSVIPSVKLTDFVNTYVPHKLPSNTPSSSDSAYLIFS